MNFLDYSNKTQSNIIPKEEFEGLIHEVFSTISDNMARSLGPLGSNATILDGSFTEATKDGHSIMKSYRFHNKYKRLIFNLIKAPCNKINNTVGDGTTTAIVFTNYLFRIYRDEKSKLELLFRLPRTFNKIWDEVVFEITEKLKKYAAPIDTVSEDTIYNICYVASNGNISISKNISDIYKLEKSPIIKQKNSPTNKSYIKEVEGFEFPANIIDEAYIRNEDLSVEEDNIHILIFDHKIETDFCSKFIIPINETLKAQGKKLLVLAPFYDEFLCNTTLKQYLNYEYQKNNKLNLILAQFNMNKLTKNQLTDLAVILRTTVLNQEIASTMMACIEQDGVDSMVRDILENEDYIFYRTIGYAKDATLSCTNGSIFKIENISNDNRYQDILRSAKKELADIVATTDDEKQSYITKIYEINSRISQLELKNYIYYIGADSALQKQIIWDSVEDVIKCTRSATKHGVVPGCQLSIMQACNSLIGELCKDINEDDIENLSNEFKLKLSIINIITQAAVNVYAAILRGPDGVGIIKTIENWHASSSNEDGAKQLVTDAMNKCNDIILESIKSNKVFDLESLEFNDKILTSAETDIMVLSAASELIKILISGNQCIFLDTEINSDEMYNTDVRV